MTAPSPTALCQESLLCHHSHLLRSVYVEEDVVGWGTGPMVLRDRCRTTGQTTGLHEHDKTGELSCEQQQATRQGKPHGQKGKKRTSTKGRSTAVGAHVLTHGKTAQPNKHNTDQTTSDTSPEQDLMRACHGVLRYVIPHRG